MKELNPPKYDPRSNSSRQHTLRGNNFCDPKRADKLLRRFSWEQPNDRK
jgi:hypothetical protein